MPPPESLGTTRVFPMQLQIGDRMTDSTAEWEVVGRPYTTAGGKNAHVRIQRVNRPGVMEIRSWGTREKVSVRRARTSSALSSRHGVACQMLRVRTGRPDHSTAVRATVLVRGWRSRAGAIATYEAHPPEPTDTRAYSAVSTTVPQYQMRKAHSTTPGEDPPQVDPRSAPPRRTRNR
jgi:hypothetical protein